VCLLGVLLAAHTRFFIYTIALFGSSAAYAVSEVRSRRRRLYRSYPFILVFVSLMILHAAVFGFLTFQLELAWSFWSWIIGAAIELPALELLLEWAYRVCRLEDAPSSWPELIEQVRATGPTF
jgi:hypothetical protein